LRWTGERREEVGEKEGRTRRDEDWDFSRVSTLLNGPVRDLLGNAAQYEKSVNINVWTGLTFSFSGKRL
jgi:hypothetical protein